MANLLKVSVIDFKKANSCASFQVVRSPKTQKLFVSTDNEKVFRCQQDLDINEPVQFIGETMEELCLVNVGRGENTLATF